jgi:hypothetical protein
VRASAAGHALGAPMDLTVVAGPLAELLNPGTAWPKMEANLRTALGGDTLQVLATSGPLQRLIGLRDVPLALQATLPGARATLNGNVGNLAAPTGLQFLPGALDVLGGRRRASLRLPAPVSASDSSRWRRRGGRRPRCQAGKSDAEARPRIRWRDRPALSADLTSRLSMPRRKNPRPTRPRCRTGPSACRLLSRDAQPRLRAERLLLHLSHLAQPWSTRSH